MKKTVKVVMLATKKALVIGDLIIEVDRPNILVKYTGTASFMKTPIPQELYLISDDEIKEGDWYYSPETKQVYNQSNHETSLPCRKIIATTNTSLNDSVEPKNREFVKAYNQLLPQIPESFIQAYIKAYNEGSPITEVNVEYEQIKKREITSIGTMSISNTFITKTKPNNTVIIRETKNYNFEDLCSLTTFIRENNYKFEGKGMTNTEIIELWKKNGEI